ncbi:MAG: hypothetical protein D6714_13925 [Bacteroidetes bacterium]|nr:MAG: hypothetical protein D6714_13925 [Bacteroidota bacterium]
MQKPLYMKKSHPSLLPGLFLLLLFSWGCDQKPTRQTTPVFQAGQPFDLKINEKASLRDGDLEVEFVRILEDSRCPEGVNCVQAGQVRVQITTTTAGNTQTAEMTLRGKEDAGTSTRAGDYAIELAGVSPYPQGSTRIDPKDYSVRLVVTRE